MKRIKKNKIVVLIAIMICIVACAQTKDTFSKKLTNYEVSKENPYGKPNPKAPVEIKTFDKLIGVCNCKSLQAGGDTLALKWRWKYILNGFGVQDDGWFGNDTIQSAFTSIRILNPKTKKWHVPFFTPNMIRNPNIWIGGKEGKNIVLKRTQKTQKGGEVESVLTFSNITDKGFYWEGKMVNPQTNTSNVFWKIWCTKEE